MYTNCVGTECDRMMHLGAYRTQEHRIPTFNSNRSPLKVKESLQMCVCVYEGVKFDQGQTLLWTVANCLPVRRTHIHTHTRTFPGE